MWTDAQQAEFDERGFVRVQGVFSRAEAAAMEDHVWAALERKHGVLRDEPATWKLPPSSGLQPLRTHRVFAPIGGPALEGALDQLIGPARWVRPKHWGQFLVSFPAPADARWRTTWHTDFPYSLPPDRVAGALVISFLGAVPPCTGGTLVLSGSPRLVARFLEAKPHLRAKDMKVVRRALFASDPWLTALGRDWSEEDRLAELSDRRQTLGGIPLRVAELTGDPGDVVVGHPWLLHSPVPHFGDRPRFMRVQRIRAA